MTAPESKPPAPVTKAITPVGLNHLVLNVRDLDESHRFWTDIIGFEHVGTLRDRPNIKMRFYSGRRDGRLDHHDIALVESADIEAPSTEWSMTGSASAINHIAVTLADRESWLAQLEFLQSKSIEFKRRVDHGMTHSVYIRDPNGYGVELLYELPREVWEGDVDAALNYAENLPTEGVEALSDETKVPIFSGEQ